MVYVDNFNRKYGRLKMCHMVADNLEELHSMADKIGIKRKWFQDKNIPHYDICLQKKKLAIKNGATEITAKQIVYLFRKNSLTKIGKRNKIIKKSKTKN